MNEKTILVMAIMLVVMASSAFATMTVTITSPTNNTVYNNLPANIQGIPITFTIVDNNDSAQDMNLTIRYGPLHTLIANNAGTELINDKNIYDYNTNGSLYSSTFGCVIKDHTPTLATCTYNFQLPAATSWIDGNTYWFDVNAVDFNSLVKATSGINEDVNATAWISINNRLGTMDSVKSLLAPIGLILIAALLIVSIIAISVLGADPTKTAIMVVTGTIVIAVIAMVFGYFYAIM